MSGSFLIIAMIIRCVLGSPGLVMGRVLEIWVFVFWKLAHEWSNNGLNESCIVCNFSKKKIAFDGAAELSMNKKTSNMGNNEV